LVFQPEFSDEDSSKIVNIKSILYVVPQIDFAIPKPIKTIFTTQDHYLTLLIWLKGLSQKNKEYGLLFARLAFQKTRCFYQNLPQGETPLLADYLQQKVLVDPDLHNDSFYPQILVSKKLLSDITIKLQIIEKTLLSDSSASLQFLFEEVSPILGKYYRKLRLKFSGPEQALEALWGQKKNGIDYSDLQSLLSLEELDNLPNNTNLLDENFLPETFFSEYKNKLISEEILPLDKFVQRHSQRKEKIY